MLKIIVRFIYIIIVISDRIIFDMFMLRRFLVLISMIIFIILLSIATIAITPPHLFSIYYSVEKQEGDVSFNVKLKALCVQHIKIQNHRPKLDLSGPSCDQDRLDLELDN